MAKSQAVVCDDGRNFGRHCGVRLLRDPVHLDDIH